MKDLSKKWLKVELGSRGEIEDCILVSSSWNDIEDDLKDCVKSNGFDDEEYIEEFFGLNGRFGNDDDDVLICGLGEECCEYYIEYDKYVDDCNELLRLWEMGKKGELMFSNLMEKFW